MGLSKRAILTRLVGVFYTQTNSLLKSYEVFFRAVDMPSLDELTSLMSRLGASRSEVKVYFRAVDMGSININEVSELLRVDEAEAHALIEGMVAKGLLKPSGGLYVASDPRDVASSLLKLKVEEVNAELQRLHGEASKLATLLDQYYAEHRMGVKPEELLKPLGSLEDMELYTVDMINKAVREVDIFTAGFGWLDRVSESLDATRPRGVKLKVLMRIADENSRRAAERLLELGAEVRLQKEPWYPLRGTIVDEKRLVFLIWATERKTKYYRPHYTENQGLIKVFKEAFEKRWSEAAPLNLGG